MFHFSASSLNESDLKPRSYFDRKWTFWRHLPLTVLNILHSKTRQTVFHMCLVVSLRADLLLWRGAHSRCESGSVTLRHLMALFSNLKLCRDCFSNHTGSGNIGITNRAQISSTKHRWMEKEVEQLQVFIKEAAIKWSSMRWDRISFSSSLSQWNLTCLNQHLTFLSLVSHLNSASFVCCWLWNT